ncbi:MAG: dienelactone hydrolase family protein [Cyclobacteriaceae bacterium]|nr:dienelactone hydrolase family protein [Cyclobacteriaceae bacterium]MCX7637348.1 dienelactone hydrolase family protein [Cyclobacteriaceae bacterium]MDW8330431.1 dienelactone hydrolase family protein [Cyclobacteriaceae bacterium]
MRQFVFLFGLLVLTLQLSAQDVALCHTPATEKFALFASNKQFLKDHPNPVRYVHQSDVGKMISFATPNGPDARGYLLMAKNKTNNWIFVFQEWWGLNDHIKREAEKLYNELGNVNVLALDMYDGKLADKREDAARYMSEFKQDRGNAIVQGALNYAGKNARIGTVGWCFGGGQALQAALTAGKQAVACVMYYGMPEENVERLKTLNCDVLNIWPTQDQWINKNVMDKFEANMKAAGKKLTIKAYEADHAFANPSNPKHNPEFTADAFRHTVQFFKARMK